jgi:hypothetical protein
LTTAPTLRWKIASTANIDAGISSASAISRARARSREDSADCTAAAVRVLTFASKSFDGPMMLATSA